MDNGLPQKLSKTASIVLSESSRLEIALDAALTSPPNASINAG